MSAVGSYQRLTCYEIILDKGKLPCFVASVVIGAAEEDVEVVNLERAWVEVSGDEEGGERDEREEGDNDGGSKCSAVEQEGSVRRRRARLGDVLEASCSSEAGWGCKGAGAYVMLLSLWNEVCILVERIVDATVEASSDLVK